MSEPQLSPEELSHQKEAHQQWLRLECLKQIPTHNTNTEAHIGRADQLYNYVLTGNKGL